MKVRITLTEEALGSAPSNEDLLATYIASKAPTSELSAEEIDNIKAQNAEDRITVFYKSADGTPFQYNYQVKGMFKDSCQMLAKAGKAGYSGGKACAALKAYKKAIDGLIFVYPREIHYDTHGLKMGYCERSLRAQTPMGERISNGMKCSTARTGQKAKLLACGFWFARIATDGFTAKSSAGPGWKGWMPGCGLNSRRPHSAWQ